MANDERDDQVVLLAVAADSNRPKVTADDLLDTTPELALAAWIAEQGYDGARERVQAAMDRLLHSGDLQDGGTAGFQGSDDRIHLGFMLTEQGKRRAERIRRGEE